MTTIEWPALQISQRKESNLHGRAYCFTSVGSAQLSKNIVQVRLNGRSCQTEILSHPFCRMALGYASENLHLS